MDIVYKRQQHFPRLAWVASVTESSIHVIHGDWVETQPKYFGECIWDGEFEKGRIHKSSNVFGSAGVNDEGDVYFVTSTSTLDGLYYAQVNEGVTVSNSLPAILAGLGDELDGGAMNLHILCDDVILGLDKYTSTLKTSRGSVHRLFHNNLKVTGGLASEIAKPIPQGFPDYNAYKSYLQNTLSKLLKNARSENRDVKMVVVATQSSGFDTTAINSLVAGQGVSSAYTVTTGNVRGRSASTENESDQPSDDGSEISRALGMTSIPLSRRTFLDKFPREALYYCSIPRTTDANLLELYESIESPTIILTGQFGEVWRRKLNPAVVNGNLVRSDSAGQGLGELRLDCGFVQAAIPFIGGQRRAEIFKISNSDNMRPYQRQDDNTYDKPIPRRIGVEAGVTASLFGQNKIASTVTISRPTMPLDSELRKSYLDYLRKRHHSSIALFLMPVIRIANGWIIKSSPQHYRLIYYWKRLCSRFHMQRYELRPLLLKLDSELMCYCVNRRVQNYSRWLQDWIK